MKTAQTIETRELDDRDWEVERDAIALRFLGVPAADFVKRYKAGDYEVSEPDGLMAVLGYFPELD